MLSRRNFQKALLKVVLAAALIGATVMGWPQYIWKADVSHISSAMVLLFGYGLWGVWKDKWESVTWAAQESLSLGLIGNVIGFILLFKDMGSSGTANVLAATSVAFLTTLVGGVFYLWLSTMFHIFGPERKPEL